MLLAIVLQFILMTVLTTVLFNVFRVWKKLLIDLEILPHLQLDLLFGHENNEVPSVFLLYVLLLQAV